MGSTVTGLSSGSVLSRVMHINFGMPHIPEFGEVARPPTRVHGAGRERWLLLKRVVKDMTLAASSLQPRPRPHVPAEAEIALEPELRLPRFFD
jgi:hypothetical protein